MKFRSWLVVGVKEIGKTKGVWEFLLGVWWINNDIVKWLLTLKEEKKSEGMAQNILFCVHVH